MLARLQRVIALVTLTGAGWCWWVAGRDGDPFWIVAGCLLIFAPAPAIAVEFALMQRVNRADPAPPASVGERLIAWWQEVLACMRVFGWRQPWREWAEADHLPAQPSGQPAVLFVHGFFCNRAVWNPWMRKLRARGVPFVALNLEPLFGSIDDYAPLIDAAVTRATRATGQPPLLVAHSMGGLAVRAWLQAFDADARTKGVVTIGTPHHGTALSRRARAHNARQMQFGSRWLQRLAGLEPRVRYARFTCFYGHCDNIVFPASTATLPGADNRHLRGVAHVRMADHPAVFSEVLRRLELEPAAAMRPL